MSYFFAVLALGLANFCFVTILIHTAAGNSPDDFRQDISALETRVAELEETP